MLATKCDGTVQYVLLKDGANVKPPEDDPAAFAVSTLPIDE